MIKKIIKNKLFIYENKLFYQKVRTKKNNKINT